MEFDRYIRLVVPEKLDSDEVKAWFKTVKQHGPSNIISSVSIKDGKNVSLIHKAYEHHHSYDINLKRDLTDDEVEDIVVAWNDVFVGDDFNIESNTTEYEYEEVDESEDDVNEYDLIAEELGKSLHAKWYQEKTESGWRYGMRQSLREKTHPMIVPWEQLPEKYKQDSDAILETVLEVFEKHGYKVTKED